MFPISLRIWLTALLHTPMWRKTKRFGSQGRRTLENVNRILRKWNTQIRLYVAAYSRASSYPAKHRKKMTQKRGKLMTATKKKIALAAAVGVLAAVGTALIPVLTSGASGATFSPTTVFTPNPSYSLSPDPVIHATKNPPCSPEPGGC